MIRPSFILFICISLLTIVSCSVDRDPCLLPKTTSLRLGAYQVIDSSQTVTDSALPHPLWIAIDSNIALQYPEKTSKFTLLLSSLADSCRFALQPDSAVASFDTLTFYYQRQLQFLSNSCGYTYYFNITSVKNTFHNLDSVKLQNTTVNSDANSKEHLQLFF